VWTAWLYYDSVTFKKASEHDLTACISKYEKKLDELNIKYNKITYEKQPDAMSKSMGNNCEWYYINIDCNKFPDISNDDLDYLFNEFNKKLDKKYDVVFDTQINIKDDVYTGDTEFLYKNSIQYIQFDTGLVDAFNEVDEDTTDSSINSNASSSTSTVTLGQQNALDKAIDYLNYSAFSYNGLVEQLEFEGFTHDEAIYGTDNCGADWNEQAAIKAQDYLDYSSFSRSELIDQLEFD
jgi:hypothetical protein